MSKLFRGDGETLYRVVVDHWLADMSSVYLSQTFGPFATLGAAKATVTRDSSWWGRGGKKFTARIEATTTNWWVTHV